MALPSSTYEWDTYYTSTWYKMVGKDPIDNIFDTNALLVLMTKKGKVKRQSGGTEIHIPLEYGENDTVTSIGRGGTVTLDDTDPLTKAIYHWKYIVGNLTRFFTDEQENKGEAQIIDMAAAKLGNLKKSMNKYLNVALFGDGSGNGYLDPLGLDVIIPEDPTASSTTVGGIDQSVETWWRTNYYDAGGRAVETYLLTDMRDMLDNCIYNDESPDIIVTDQTSLHYYEDETNEKYVIVNKTLGDAGFQHLQYKGLPLVWDRQCKARSMYFVNSDYLYIVSNMDTEAKLTPWKDIPNKLDRVAQAVSGLNIVASQRRVHGVLFDIGETS